MYNTPVDCSFFRICCPDSAGSPLKQPGGPVLCLLLEPIPQQRLHQGAELAASFKQAHLHLAQNVLVDVEGHLHVVRTAVLRSWPSHLRLRLHGPFAAWGLLFACRHRFEITRKLALLHTQFDFPICKHDHAYTVLCLHGFVAFRIVAGYNNYGYSELQKTKRDRKALRHYSISGSQRWNNSRAFRSTHRRSAFGHIAR
jgi:hypothetical protein